MYQPTRSRLTFRRRLLEVLLAIWIATWAFQQFQQYRSSEATPPPPATVGTTEPH